jgi:hypothetical protein
VGEFPGEFSSAGVRLGRRGLIGVTDLRGVTGVVGVTGTG